MSSINPSVIEQVSASMSNRSLQHQLIASNIANRDTPGYQRLKLQFDHALGAAVSSADAPDTAVSLEQDLVALSSNVSQYQAMARVLNRYFSILAAITNQSRG